QVANYPVAYSNWMRLLNWEASSLYEVAICGDQARDYGLQLMKKPVFNALFVAQKSPSQLPMLKGKCKETTWIYVCENRLCKKPVQDINQAAEMLLSGQ
ncbi:MAG: hypothetical protein ACPF8V_00455, partial [Luteibaculum sp.]